MFTFIEPLVIPAGYRLTIVTEDGTRYVSVCRWDQRHAAWRMAFSVPVEPGEGFDAAKRRALTFIK